MYRQTARAGPRHAVPLRAPEPLKFWMKNTYIPLDMIFIDADKHVVYVEENAEPLTLNAARPRRRYAVRARGAGRLGARARRRAAASRCSSLTSIDELALRRTSCERSSLAGLALAAGSPLRRRHRRRAGADPIAEPHHRARGRDQGAQGHGPAHRQDRRRARRQAARHLHLRAVRQAGAQDGRQLRRPRARRCARGRTRRPASGSRSRSTTALIVPPRDPRVHDPGRRSRGQRHRRSRLRVRRRVRPTS